MVYTLEQLHAWKEIIRVTHFQTLRHTFAFKFNMHFLKKDKNVKSSHTLSCTSESCVLMVSLVTLVYYTGNRKGSPIHLPLWSDMKTVEC